MTRELNRLSWAVALGATLAGSWAFAQDASAPMIDREKLSYALGLDLGTQMRGVSVDVDPAIFAQGLTAGLSGGSAQMTNDDARIEIAKLQAELRRRQIEARQKAAEEHPKAGEAAPAEGAQAQPTPPVAK
jgi:hypothetical protein